MKTFTNALSTHLDGEVTTLCTCWRIERTDGDVLGFTTLDYSFEYNGVQYDSQNGFGRTAMTAGSDMSVDNMDVAGVLDSESLDSDDLRNGLYDFARVFVFALNYEDVSQGELPLRTGWFGEVSLTQRGEFTAELRGLTQALSHSTIEVFTPECRADFCDKRCKLDPAKFTRRATVLGEIQGRNQFRATALPDVPSLSTAGAHRVWGVRLMDVPDLKHGGFAEMKFYDQSLNEINGGKAYASTDTKNHTPGKARDKRTDTNWSTANFDPKKPEESPIQDAVWYVIFDKPVDVKEISMTATRLFTESPTRFALFYGTLFGDSDSQIDFTEVAQFTANWTAGGQNNYWGIGQTGSAPLNGTADFSKIPVPFEGTSTYVGGTVTFRSGDNQGKSMEIIDYSSKTQTVTLFDNMPFEIKVGDTFDIMQGCNKDRETCRIYDNIINFRGEPDVPGQDEYLKYPDASTG